MSEDIINALRLASDRDRATVGSPNILDEAADELKKLLGMLEVANEMAEHYAQERDTERAEADRLARRNALLVAEIETLRDERDELRRRLCSYEGAWRRVNNPLDEAHLHDRPHEIAKEWGWDCFKEQP